MTLKEKFIPLLTRLVNDNHIQENISWYYSTLAQELYNESISVNDFKEVFRPLITEKLKAEYNLENKECFISIPITGQEELAECYSKQARNKLKEMFPTCNFFIPFDITQDKNKRDSYYMGKDIEKLMDCDVIIQMSGWENSKGCRVEDFVATTYNIQKIQYADIEKFIS